jgi:hypothetical protein
MRDFAIWIPLILYVLVYVLLLLPASNAHRLGRHLQSLKRPANGCYRSTCIYFPPDELGLDCDVDPDHWRQFRNSPRSCGNSQAHIGQEERQLYEHVFSARRELWRNIVALLAIIATIIAAVIEKGQ